MARRRFGFHPIAAMRRWLDRTLDNSFVVQIVALVMLTTVISTAGTVLAYKLLDFGDWREAIWWTWNRVINPSMLPDDGVTDPAIGRAGSMRIAVSIGVILCGWVVFGLLISILTNAFQERLERIKSGTADVVSSDHTIILGWDSTVFSVIDQLGSDDEQASGDVVVLADRDAKDMRLEARKYCRPAALRKVYFRQGSIAAVASIRDLRITRARQVIILGGVGDDPDDEVDAAAGVAGPASREVLKAVLACYQAVSEAKRWKRGAKLPIVATVGSGEAARIIERGVPGTVSDRLWVRVVHADDFLGRMTAQCAVEPLLAAVYMDLLSYEGAGGAAGASSSEIYVTPVPAQLVGKTFDEGMFCFDRAIPIGYVASGRTVVNPKPGSPDSEYRFQKTDRIVAVAESSEGAARFRLQPAPVVKFRPPEQKARPRRLLVLGEGHKLRRVLDLLPGLLAPGSVVATNHPIDDLPKVEGVRFEQYKFRTASRRVTEAQRAAATLVGQDLTLHDCVVLVDDTADPDAHDAKVLMDLTALHAAAAGAPIGTAVVVELLDHRSVELARCFGAMATIVSSTLVSNYLVQLAVEPARGDVFREFLDSRGNEVHVKPVDRYVSGREEVITFDVIVARARSLGEIAIGYVPRTDEPMRINPRDRTTAQPAARYNQIIVVAES